MEIHRVDQRTVDIEDDRTEHESSWSTGSYRSRSSPSHRTEGSGPLTTFCRIFQANKDPLFLGTTISGGSS